MIMGEPEDLWLLASDAGYGFTVRLKELITDRRAGKSVLNVPEKSIVLPPAFVASPDSLVCAASSEGKMLAFKVSDLPEMPKGKGNKIFDIPSKKAEAREEMLTAMAVVPPNGKLVMYSGEKQKTLDWSETQGVQGPAGPARRGAHARLARDRPARRDRGLSKGPPFFR